jgi:hypothetical protein
MSDCPDLPTTAEGWEERIKADFQKHPGSWRPDPENWYREGWLAGFDAACPTPSTERIARVLNEHAPDIRDGYWCGCRCGWSAPINYDLGHRAHVASVLAHLYGEGSEAGPDSGKDEG